jgi:phosphoglycerol transferase MdoB-like AlkP superfamily enzyme
VHLRAPSVDKGVQSFLWALFFFLYLFLGMLAVGVDKGNALIFSALLGFGIFFYVRIFGEEKRSRIN